MTLSPGYLLDTTMLSDLIRHPQDTVASRIASAREDTVCTRIVIAAELRFGAMKSGSRKLAETVDLIVSALEVLPLEAPADQHYGRVRHQLSRQGMPIGPNDLLIAAHAPAADLTPGTASIREFSRVPGLKVENWLEN